MVCYLIVQDVIPNYWREKLFIELGVADMLVLPWSII